MAVIKDLYIAELLEGIENTQVWEGIERKAESYGEGIKVLISCFAGHRKMGSQVFFIGNGGSASIASHMAADYMKNVKLKTYSFHNSSVITCMGNDYGYEYVFSKPLELLAEENDLLVAISSSGNSKNIINAVNAARRKKARILTFTGFQEDNVVKKLGDINVYVPSNKYGIVESIHNLILQQAVDLLIEKDKKDV